MNYNNFRFWILFGLVYLLYWRLGRRRQNAVLLVASYLFYGAWDYRFLYLILLSTVIDFIGGLGVADVELAPGKRRRLGLLLVLSAALLTSDIHYGLIPEALRSGNFGALLPHGLAHWAVTIATAAAALGYGAFLPRVHRLPPERRRKVFLVLSMVANLGILGFFKYCDFFVGGFVQLAAALGFGH